MRRIVTLLALVAVVAVVATAPTGAAAAPQLQEQTNTTAAAPSGERIDSSLTLVSSSYDADAGTARIELHADDHVAVTLSDASGFVDGGEITRQTYSLEPGTHTIELPATETSSGLVAVSIATQDVLYGEVIEEQQKLLPGLQSQFSGAELMASVVVAASVGVGVMVLLLVVVGKKLKKRRSL